MRRTASTVVTTAIAGVLSSTLYLAGGPAMAAESTRALPPFIAVNAKGAFAMTVEAGKTQSVVVRGDDKFIAELKTTVVDNELQITMSDKTYDGGKGAPRITITVLSPISRAMRSPSSFWCTGSSPSWS